MKPIFELSKPRITQLVVLTTAAGLARLGFIANFISEPVLKGFIIGLALTIIVGQLPKLFGVEAGSGNFFQKSWDLVENLDTTSGATLAIGAASLALIIGLKQLAPRLPGALIAVALSVIAVALLELDEHGVAIVGAIETLIAEHDLRTPDMGGKASTKELGKAIASLVAG